MQPADDTIPIPPPSREKEGEKIVSSRLQAVGPAFCSEMGQGWRRKKKKKVQPQEVGGKRLMTKTFHPQQSVDSFATP